MPAIPLPDATPTPASPALAAQWQQSFDTCAAVPMKTPNLALALSNANNNTAAPRKTFLETLMIQFGVQEAGIVSKPFFRQQGMSLDGYRAVMWLSKYSQPGANQVSRPLNIF